MKSRLLPLMLAAAAVFCASERADAAEFAVAPAAAIIPGPEDLVAEHRHHCPPPRHHHGHRHCHSRRHHRHRGCPPPPPPPRRCHSFLWLRW